MNDIAVRAAKTFVQAFLGVATVEVVVGADVETLRLAAYAATSAALSVVWNAALAWASK